MQTFAEPRVFISCIHTCNPKPSARDILDHYINVVHDVMSELTINTSNSSRILKGESVTSHNDMMNATVENDRSPPDKLFVFFVAKALCSS